MRSALPPEVLCPTGHSWPEFAFRRRLLAVAFLVPFVALTVTKVFSFGSRVLDFVIAGSFLLLLVAVYGCSSLRCPRCGEPFYSSMRISNPFTKRCLHCGLRRGDREYGAV